MNNIHEEIDAMVNEKMVAAIQAAVSAYMMAEEQSALPRAAETRLWSRAGRQEIMARRQLVIMRIHK